MAKKVSISESEYRKLKEASAKAGTLQAALDVVTRERDLHKAECERLRKELAAANEALGSNARGLGAGEADNPFSVTGPELTADGRVVLTALQYAYLYQAACGKKSERCKKDKPKGPAEQDRQEVPSPAPGQEPQADGSAAGPQGDSDGQASGVDPRYRNAQDRGNNGARRDPHPEAKTELRVLELDRNDPRLKSGEYVMLGYEMCVRFGFRRGCVVRTIFKVPVLAEKDPETGALGASFTADKLPGAVLDKSNYDISLVAKWVTDLIVGGIPYYRQSKLMGMTDFDIKHGTISGLTKKVARKLQRLYDTLVESVMKEDYVLADETFGKMQSLTKNTRDEFVRKVYLWGFLSRATGLCAFYFKDGSRGAKVLDELSLKYGLPALVQTDSYIVYRVYSELERIPCLQHLKRPLVSMEGVADAERLLAEFRKLFHFDKMHVVGEAEPDGRIWTEEDHRLYRESYAPRVLAEIQSQAKALIDSGKYPEHSPMYNALNLIQKERVPMENLFKRGDTVLTTNDLERLNRYMSTYRKNSMMIGSPEGGEVLAIWMSLVASCVNCGKNPQEYIMDVYRKILALPDDATFEDYRKLLPDLWVSPGETVWALPGRAATEKETERFLNKLKREEKARELERREKERRERERQEKEQLEKKGA